MKSLQNMTALALLTGAFSGCGNSAEMHETTSKRSSPSVEESRVINELGILKLPEGTFYLTDTTNVNGRLVKLKYCARHVLVILTEGIYNNGPGNTLIDRTYLEEEVYGHPGCEKGVYDPDVNPAQRQPAPSVQLPSPSTTET